MKRVPIFQPGNGRDLNVATPSSIHVPRERCADVQSVCAFYCDEVASMIINHCWTGRRCVGISFCWSVPGKWLKGRCAHPLTGCAARNVWYFFEREIQANIEPVYPLPGRKLGIWNRRLLLGVFEDP